SSGEIWVSGPTPQSASGASWMCTCLPSLAGTLLTKRIEQLKRMVRSTRSSRSATSMMFIRRCGVAAGNCARAAPAPRAPRIRRTTGRYQRSALERGIRNSVAGSRETPADRGLRRVAVDVAGAAAVGELAHGVVGPLEYLRIRGGPEVLGMAAGAGAGVRGRGPGDLVRAAGVTAAAAERRAVVARIAAGRMAEVQRVPVGVGMAGAAVEARPQVPGRHADRAGIVVAAAAAAEEQRVVDLGRLPAERAVAGVALLGGRDVDARQADRLHGVVAARAGVRRDGGVIEARRSPAITRVA